MKRHALGLLVLLALPVCGQAKDPQGVNAIPALRIAELNEALAEPSDEYDAPARILKAYVPIYPVSRLLSGKTGSCRVEMSIGPDGNAEDLRPDSAADQKMCAHALHALRYWQFAPATKDGRYVRTRFRMPFNYDIRR